MTGLGSAMAQIAASVAEMKLGSATKTKGITVGFTVQPGKQRKDDMAACNERERVAKAKTGIAFENTRAQVIVALRLSTGDGRDIDLAFGGTALEAYVDAWPDGRAGVTVDGARERRRQHDGGHGGLSDRTPSLALGIGAGRSRLR